jgi:hypothetical protein
MTSAPLRAHRTDILRVVYCLCCGRTGNPTGAEAVPRTWRWCQVGPQTGPTCQICSSRAYRRGTDEAPEGIQPRDIDPACPALEPRMPRMEIAPLPVAKPASLERIATTEVPAPDPRVETASVIFPPRRIARPTARLQRTSEPTPAPASRRPWSEVMPWVALTLALLIALAALLLR